jgi:hypothetical protein
MEYTVVDSDIQTGGKYTFWMDNHRIITTGYVGPKPATVEEKSKIKPAIYIWDIGTGGVEKYADAGALCFDQGYIYYPDPAPITRDSSRPSGSNWFEGLFGQERRYEQLFTKEEGKRWAQTHMRSPITGCREVAQPVSMQGRYWKPLKEGDGYLDGGLHNVNDPDKKEKTIWKRADGASLEQPFTFIKDFSNITFHEFRDAYFLQKIAWYSTWKRDGCIPVWWLTHVGETNKECITIKGIDVEISRHIDGVTGGGAQLYPTLKGYFVIFGTNRNRYDAVLLGRDKAQILLSGLISSPAVSPDGCKVALSFAKDWEAVSVGGKGRTTLKMINLCD